MARTANSKSASQTAKVNAGQGAKAGMKPAPYKPTTNAAGTDKVAAPVIRRDPIGGVGKTNPKLQPMYTGKPSSKGKTTVQLDSLSQAGSGILPDDGKGFTNKFSDQAGGSGRRLSKDSQKGQ